ncbi:uncharacterized protein Pyn_15847 [Prunus yedoensis var. nudiflora]|uniref:Uncharacterized protein n=1 Tax=Prunus yedoensis var. nudiflora TaxID=2094558 RepID=A0A314ZE97_PRUYE|nr:uncharacterized protein Pyn_15847 [Prunus yedoensis var. nudiflora]
MDPNRVEAERLLRIAEKLLHSRDLSSCRNFAVLAQEIEQLLDGSDQILAITDVLLAADKRVNNHLDWYTVHQVEAHGGWRWLWVGRRGDTIAKLHLHRQTAAIFFVEAHLHRQTQDMGVLINFWGREGERKRKRSRRGHQKQYGSFTSITNNSSTNVIPKTMILAFVVFRPTGSTNGDFGSTSGAAHCISAISGIWTTMVFLMCLEILLIFYTNVVELIAYGKPRKMGFTCFISQRKKIKNCMTGKRSKPENDMCGS